MQTIKFLVKDKSANTFFAEHAIASDKYDRQSIRNNDDLSPYYLMKDEIILKKSSGIQHGQQVIFQLSDQSAASRKPLTNTYTYNVEGYDDVSLRLTLIDFKIELDETEK